MDRKLRLGAGCAAGALLIATSGCSTDVEPASEVPSPTTASVESVEPVDSEVFSPRDSTPPIAAGSGTQVDVVVTFTPVSETGVPGIASDDEFCRSWSRYAGSFNALSFAWSARLPVDVAELEVSAAAAIVASVDSMAASLPAEIESNRQAFVVDVPGPFLRRAERALEYLAEAGVDDAAAATLGDAWIAAITDAGLTADDLVVDVPQDLAAARRVAAERFVAELPSMLDDPTLDTTQYDISPALGYISDNCPDQGVLAGNDNVGQDDL